MNARRAGALSGVEGVVLGASSVALAVLCVRGIFVRYNADDYWTASVVVRRGFWQSQSFWYQRWSGRFAYTFLIGIVERIGTGIVPALVPLMIVAWFAATYVLLKRLRVEYPAALAAVVVYAAVEGAPDVPQSILWQTGLLTYVFPIVGLMAWLATTIERDRVRWYDAAVPFALAGFSEGNTLLQMILLVFLLRAQPRIFGTALIASAAAFAIMGLAPGNAVRISISEPHSIAWIATQTITSTATVLMSELTAAGIPLLFVLVAFVCRAEVRLHNVVTAWAVAICTALAICLVSAITLPTGPPVRTLIVVHVAVVIAVAVSGAAIPQRFERYAFLLIVILAVAGPLVSAAERGRNIPVAAAFARAWDRLDAQLRQLPGRDVVVADAPGSVGTLRFITHDRYFWSNRCISDYYSLNGIASPPLLIRPKPVENLHVYATEGPGRHDDNNVVRLRFSSD